jgi:hypothetical protein
VTLEDAQHSHGNSSVYNHISLEKYTKIPTSDTVGDIFFRNNILEDEVKFRIWRRDHPELG